MESKSIRHLHVAINGVASHSIAMRCIAILGIVTLCNGCSHSGVPKSSEVRSFQTTVSVAAASDLQFAMDELLAEFHHLQPTIRIQVSFGSSGNFFAQLYHRAPYDIFLSADASYPNQLVEKGLADRESLFQYAKGQLVLWVPKDCSLDIKRLGIQTLLDPSVRKVAIANPLHAPYGKAAEAALRNLGVYDSVRDRLVFGDNVAQAAQFIESGAADVGIIAHSLALAPAMRDKGSHWPIPVDAYPAMDQVGVVLGWANDPESTDKFRAFVAGPAAKRVFQKFGFTKPGA